MMEMEVIPTREQPGVPPGTAVVASVQGGEILLVMAGEVLPPIDLGKHEEVDDLPVPVPRVPKAHKAYGLGSKTTRGRGLSDQPRKNVRLRLGY